MRRIPFLLLAACAALALPHVAGARSAPDLVVTVAGSRQPPGGPIVLGGVNLYTQPVAALMERFGPAPVRRVVVRNAACRIVWRSVGLVVYANNYGVRDPCVPEAARVQFAIVTGARWRTARGLRIGDPARRVRSLYPEARKMSGWWSLVTSHSPFTGSDYPRLAAGGRRVVERFLVQPMAAGD